MNYQMEKWPNFFIVGAPKAGTTSLYEYLKDIPGIFMSPVKEPNYFSITILDDNHELNPIRNKTEYLNLFRAVNEEKIIGEASTYYLSDVKAPELIHRVSPGAKILISLRDPAEREYSHFLMEEKYLKTNNSFHEELENELINYKTSQKNYALKYGLYADNIKRYIDIFGKNQVKIIIFEEWITSVEKTIRQILKFLELPDSLIDHSSLSYNEYKIIRGKISKQILQSKRISKIAKAIMTKSQRDSLREKLYKRRNKPEMREEDRKILKKFYQDDVKKLQKIIGQKLCWKNFDLED